MHIVAGVYSTKPFNLLKPWVRKWKIYISFIGVSLDFIKIGLFFLINFIVRIEGAGFFVNVQDQGAQKQQQMASGRLNWHNCN